MTKIKVLDLEGKKKGTVDLPPVFSTPLRRDVIKRAVLAQQSARYQRYGVDPMAGKRTTATSWGPGFGRARVPRRKGSGTRSAQQGALAPFTVGGRRTHPPEAAKSSLERINKKERRLAIRSAIAATSNRELVASRGHRFEVDELPLIVVDKLQNLQTTAEAKATLETLGLGTDLQRVKSGRQTRSGAARRRGRKYKQPVGPLIVITEDGGIRKAARNIPGVNVIYVSKLNAEVLAPGTHPGRLTVWTKSAIQQLATEPIGGGE